ncbi:gliding motility-associated C-terminal domain-containing protein [Ekhidna sp.]|uniref:T9SS type B sorting domain-containing protein n=1 Tax=Ekhidna sp. TaxID=2608089 RepID=UPI003BAC2E90
MKKLNFILTFLPVLLFSQELYMSGSSILHISEGATLEVGGNLENNGILQNNGTLAIYGDWTVNNNFNGLNGTLEFLGGSNQMVSIPTLRVRELIVNSGGLVDFPGNEYSVLERLYLEFGSIRLGENTRFILEPGVRVDGGSNLSYFDGTLISKGTGEKRFPLGNDGVYSPITFLETSGVDTELAVSYQRNNPSDPIPGDSLLGVSDRAFWEVELLNGSIDPAKIELEFNEEDLSDFKVVNNIRHRVNSPVIAYSNGPGGIYETLGVETLFNSDSVTFGLITSKNKLQPALGQKLYLAMGLGPQIPGEGLYYIPEAFSPNASDPQNQTFRIFGEKISEEEFELQIYNRYGVIVYSTNSFAEANQVGWNGENQKTGAQEPAGVYYYTVRFQFETRLPVQQKGAFYLVK